MSKIWEKSLGYNLLRAFADPNTRASYHKAQVRGKLPEDGAVIIAPNHTSTLMDAMIVLRTRKEPTVFGARADIFKKPAVAKFLRYIRIVPMARIRDGAQSVLKNIETFAEVDEVLAHGVPFCILPGGPAQAHAFAPAHRQGRRPHRVRQRGEAADVRGPHRHRERKFLPLPLAQHRDLRRAHRRERLPEGP